MDCYNLCLCLYPADVSTRVRSSCLLKGWERLDKLVTIIFVHICQTAEGPTASEQ